MKYIVILIFCFSVFSHEYEINGKSHTFIFKDKKLVSKNCKKSCMATGASVTKKQIDAFDKKAGKNPATQACKASNGEIIMAKSSLGHKTFFCKFKDNSYIHSGHLL